jgi:hypothetical protein
MAFIVFHAASRDQALIDRCLPELFDLAVVPELPMLGPVPVAGGSGKVRH